LKKSLAHHLSPPIILHFDRSSQNAIINVNRPGDVAFLTRHILFGVVDFGTIEHFGTSRLSAANKIFNLMPIVLPERQNLLQLLLAQVKKAAADGGRQPSFANVARSLMRELNLIRPAQSVYDRRIASYLSRYFAGALPASDRHSESINVDVLRTRVGLESTVFLLTDEHQATTVCMNFIETEDKVDHYRDDAQVVGELMQDGEAVSLLEVNVFLPLFSYTDDAVLYNFLLIFRQVLFSTFLSDFTIARKNYSSLHRIRRLTMPKNKLQSQR